MSSTNPGAILPAREQGVTNYVRFIVLCADRTGSYMLTSSLNSSPNIVCFGEVFNAFVKHVDYRVDGYKMFDPDERALRDKDFKQFLDTRIYCERPNEIRAVGFKLPHSHFWQYRPKLRRPTSALSRQTEGKLLEWLVGERDIRVLHLRRRNMLRRLVSRRIAVDTGVWLQYQRHGDAKQGAEGLQRFNALLSLRNAVKAIRHPMRAVAALGWALRPKKQVSKVRRNRLVLTEGECRQFFEKDALEAAHYDELFSEHDIQTLYYEDLVENYDATLESVQAFLGLDPQPLSPMTRKLNPEPLRQLLGNYDELYEVFSETPEAAYFE